MNTRDKMAEMQEEEDTIVKGVISSLQLQFSSSFDAQLVSIRIAISSNFFILVFCVF